MGTPLAVLVLAAELVAEVTRRLAEAQPRPRGSEELQDVGQNLA